MQPPSHIHCYLVETVVLQPSLNLVKHTRFDAAGRGILLCMTLGFAAESILLFSSVNDQAGYGRFVH